ncbi:hypothetical protein DDB_G0275225 [Dictyostelium discoideum AX4]|uniref:Uncharacterized protein n=1 Tax=Dictyostelium discoideum TaxID=44689 RepID=Q554J2_DICDI|nr:hypothetical protein DDB_G0275225 [Dictyostelium discoideum AX4]EAL69893.1 hypothetical protein DDB_G0275225 [Dictyostelium discoideum AX4]|eukprot:XP_643719.1 hypothetical protein DDB_G0275225 [Dictyostelium discoideum AX4]
MKYHIQSINQKSPPHVPKLGVQTLNVDEYIEICANNQFKCGNYNIPLALHGVDENLPFRYHRLTHSPDRINNRRSYTKYNVKILSIFSNVSNHRVYDLLPFSQISSTNSNPNVCSNNENDNETYDSETDNETNHSETDNIVEDTIILFQFEVLFIAATG